MRVVVSGGTGLIGGSLCEALSADGHDISILSRNPAKASTLPSNVQLVEWDAHTVGDWADVVDGADAVVNLVGESLADGRWTANRKRRIRDSRVLAGNAIATAIERASSKPSVLIQSSAVGYYGPRGDEEITEDASPGSDYLAHLCFEWEASTGGVKKFGVRRPVIRTGIVLSAKGGALPKMVLPFRFFAGGKTGSGKQYWPWIHLEDEVRAIRFLLENEEASGPFNLCAPQSVTSSEFATTIGSVLGRPSLMPVPGIALRAAFGEMATVLLDGQRAVPNRLEALGFTFNFPTLEAALREIWA